MTANQVAYQNMLATREANAERERSNRANERINKQTLSYKLDESASQVALNKAKQKEAYSKAFANKAKGIKDYGENLRSTIRDVGRIIGNIFA